MSYNSSEYMYGDREYIQIPPEFSKNYDYEEVDDDEVEIDMETEEYGGVLSSGVPSRREGAREYELVKIRKSGTSGLPHGKHQAYLEKENHARELHRRRLGLPGRMYGPGVPLLDCTDRRRSEHWVEKYSQKQRRIPVVCIKDGKISQRYMQAAELLRKVHMHNERQVLEERAAGALTLRDLRQVVGLHGFERPSIEIRRNCILVNMPGVRCLILHDKVYYLPGSPIIFPSGFDENEAFELDGEVESAFLTHGFKQKTITSDFQKDCLPLKPKSKVQRYRNDSNHRDLSIIEKLTSITRRLSIEKALSCEDQPYKVLNPSPKLNSGLESSSNSQYQILLAAPEAQRSKTSNSGPEATTGPVGCSPVQLNLLEIPPTRSEKEKETETHSKAPLELNALEICLIEVCKRLWDSYYIIDDTAQDFLLHIENNPTSTQKVYEINDLRKRLDSLRDRIKGVYEAIKEVLDDDDLLVRIEISKFWNQPENWDNKAILESTFFDSEILLECYEQEVEGLIRTVNRLNAQLDDAIEVMQIHLATIRNNFLKGEISLDIVGVCVGFVSAIASIFGMNIQSGLEKNVDIFWFMAYTMITLCVFAGIIVILMFRRLQL
ncbi:magnesium transporter CorA-like protein [Cryptosporidium canis]|nr:magnesium transporter CorA-like protein [Cryptosporidium canis]